ncbi:MAG: hypothetical protein DID89_2727548043 [Candidatus Nitrotoga sp. CP45]|nr:MAG: hypothetical protein DID89_2727548043 [Candidatus Nitrotoga sp. CP45]
MKWHSGQTDPISTCYFNIAAGVRGVGRQSTGFYGDRVGILL